MHTYRMLITAVLATVAASACDDGISPDRVSRIVVVSTKTEVMRGDTLRFHAQAFADDKPLAERVVWSTSNPAMATVDSAGLVRAIAEGDVEIIATAGGVSGNRTLRIRQIDLTVQAPALPIYVGDTIRITATAHVGDSLVSVPITWRSTEHAVAVIDSTGLMVARGRGSALIIASLPGGNGSDTVNVTVQALPLAPPPMNSRIAVSDTESCAIDAAAKLYCWGSNRNGFLGTGSGVPFIRRPEPVRSPLFFRAVVTRRELVCAISIDGVLFCGGFDNPGGGRRDHVYTSIDGRGAGICAVTDDGSVYCWGQTDNPIVHNPVRIAVPEPMVAVAVSDDNGVCSLSNTGNIYCWGSANGFLAATVVALPSAVKFKQITAGDRSHCAISLDDGLHCWGEFPGVTPISSVPQPMHAHLRFKAVAIGVLTTCGAILDGTAYCWGNKHGGLLGDGDSTAPCTPPPDGSLPPLDCAYRTAAAPVATSMRFSSIALSDDHACALTTTSEVYCWGRRTAGKLGDGYSLERDEPAQVAGNPTFTRLAVADGLTRSTLFGGVSGSMGSACGLAPDGRVSCWGFNENGQLGNGTTTDSFVPSLVTGVQDIVEIAVGGHTSSSTLSCGLTSNGQAYCWGSGDFRTPVTRPQLIPSTQRFTGIAVGSAHACAIGADSAAYCWGQSTRGQLGAGSFSATQVTIPAPVAGALKFVRLSAHDSYTCGITNDQLLYCWGLDNYGRFAGATGASACATNSRVPGAIPCFSTPTLIPAVSAVVEVGTSHFNTCVINTAGNAFCWGMVISDTYARYRYEEILCTAAQSAVCTRVPRLVSGPAPLHALDRAYALGNDGALYRLVGDNNGGFSTLRLASSYTFRAFSGDENVCGITTAGQAVCWGTAANGQIGDGILPFSAVPVRAPL